MKLAKAIEINEFLKDAGVDAGHYDAEDAIQLGIEAMKRLQHGRAEGLFLFIGPLPGETPE